MNEQVKEYLNKYPNEIVDRFHQLRQLIFASTLCEPEETLWAKLPTYNVGDAFVRLIPFKDHINIEARAVLQHTDELTDYKITPKGMLQLYAKQEMPVEILKRVFAETLAG